MELTYSKKTLISNKKDDNKVNPILVSVLVVLAMALISIIGYKAFSKNNPPVITPIPTSTPTPTATETIPPTPTPITYNENPPQGYEGFFEKTPIVGGQQGYVAVPLVVDPQKPPKIVIYYHGSSQKVTTDFNNDVMKNIRIVAAQMTKANYIFVASNQHGDNYGSATAVNDSVAMIDWVRQNYPPVQEKVNVLGFSMGGMGAMKHVVLQSATVDKLALLAPATEVEKYKSADFQKFANIPVTVWHGTSDTNVPFWVATELQTYFTKNGLTLTLNKLQGKKHFDIDTEYTNEVISFFNN